MPAGSDARAAHRGAHTRDLRSDSRAKAREQGRRRRRAAKLGREFLQRPHAARGRGVLFGCARAR